MRSFRVHRWVYGAFIIFAFFGVSWDCLPSNNRDGNIKSMCINIDLQNDTLLLNLIIIPQNNNGPIHFYLPAFDCITINYSHNKRGLHVPYTNKSGHFVFSTDYLELQYSINLPRLEETISSIYNYNQCVILPEYGLFPNNGSLSTIDYTISYSDTIKQFKFHAKNQSYLQTLLPPVILFGDFEVINKEDISLYFPKNINVSEGRIESIISTIKSICKFYANSIGPNNLCEDLCLYFIKRRGGYSAHEGILLSEDLLFKENDNELLRVLSHEIAHLWWGQKVNLVSWSLGEGLSEFYSLSYLSEISENEFNLYRSKNWSLLEDDCSPQDVEEVTPSMKSYRSFSYQRLPLLFRELSYKIGEGLFRKTIKQVYSEFASTHEILSVKRLASFFPNEIEYELFAKFKGLMKAWPDFRISQVQGNCIDLEASYLMFPTIIPVTITLNDGSHFVDSLSFSPSNRVIRREYQQIIESIVLDSQFTVNQSNTLNDVWCIDTTNTNYLKWQVDFPIRFKRFDLFLTQVFFSNETPSFAMDVTTAQIKKRLSHISSNGSLLGIDANKSIFKWFVSFSSDKGDGIGWIEGKYLDDGQKIHLESLTRVHF